MAILLIAEHDNATLSDQTAKTLSAALKIGSDVHVLVAGKGAKAAADAAAKLKGVRKVLLAEADELEQRLAEPLAALIVSLAGNYDTIIAPATTSGKNVMPRVAALLDVMQVSEIIEVVSPDTFKRPIYAGNAIQTVQSTDPKKVITCAPPRSRQRARVARRRSRPSRRRPIRVSRPLSRTGCRRATARSLPRPRSSFRAAARLARRRSSRRSSCRSPTSSAPPLGVPRGRRCRLCAERLAGRPDRQGRRAGPLHRRRHLRRHPAPRRHEGLEGHRRHQQGRGSANLPGRRLRPRRRSFRHPAGVEKAL